MAVSPAPSTSAVSRYVPELVMVVRESTVSWVGAAASGPETERACPNDDPAEAER
ncbi:hypothetical protein [Halorussus marinus]|uniref:hypothetical protein n=1 Tax=Halorussus marinus TaxID=2505976 RepID=UPI00143DCEB6|nr:hypothetical protein [Halorussus marinus]